MTARRLETEQASEDDTVWDQWTQCDGCNSWQVVGTRGQPKSNGNKSGLWRCGTCEAAVKVPRLNLIAVPLCPTLSTMPHSPSCLTVTVPHSQPTHLTLTLLTITAVFHSHHRVPLLPCLTVCYTGLVLKSSSTQACGFIVERAAHASTASSRPMQCGGDR